MQAQGCMQQREGLNLLLLSTHPLTAGQHLPLTSTHDSADFANSTAAAAEAANANADDAQERAALKAETEHVFTEAQQRLRYKIEDSPLYNASHELLMVTRRVLGCSSLAV
jgi:hypothetical protein